MTRVAPSSPPASLGVCGHVQQTLPAARSACSLPPCSSLHPAFEQSPQRRLSNAVGPPVRFRKPDAVPTTPAPTPHVSCAARPGEPTGNACWAKEGASEGTTITTKGDVCRAAECWAPLQSRVPVPEPVREAGCEPGRAHGTAERPKECSLPTAKTRRCWKPGRSPHPPRHCQELGPARWKGTIRSGAPGPPRGISTFISTAAEKRPLETNPSRSPHRVGCGSPRTHRC